MSETSKSSVLRTVCATVEFAKADFSKTAALYFAPVMAVVNEVAKAMRGNLAPNNVEQTPKNTKPNFP